MKLFIISLPHSPVTSSPLGPKIPLSTPFSNTLSLCSSLNVTGQFSHQHKTTGRIIFLYCSILLFLDNKLEDKSFSPVAGIPSVHLLSISSQTQFLFPSVVCKYLNFATLSSNSVPIFSLRFYSAFVHLDVTYHILPYACITIT